MDTAAAVPMTQFTRADVQKEAYRAVQDIPAVYGSRVFIAAVIVCFLLYFVMLQFYHF